MVQVRSPALDEAPAEELHAAPCTTQGHIGEKQWTRTRKCVSARFSAACTLQQQQVVKLCSVSTLRELSSDPASATGCVGLSLPCHPRVALLAEADANSSRVKVA